MQTRTSIIAAGAGVLLVAAAVIFVRHIDRPRVVARTVAPDGTEFCVVQTCSWDFDLFTTSCYYRKPGHDRWGWFYYNHEDWYWGRGRAEIDPVAKRITIYRGGRATATFDWESERFCLLPAALSPERLRDTGAERFGAQEIMPEGWSIPLQ
jgi:hypothetical protein